MQRAFERQPEGFADALKMQGRVLHALLMREVLTRYGRHNIGFLWIFAEPMMFTLMVVTMWKTIGRTAEHGIPVVPFLCSGYMPFLMWRHCMSRSVHSLQYNMGLLYHRQVRLIDVVYARMLLEIAGTIVAFICVWSIFTFFGVLEPPDNFWTVYSGFFFWSWFCFACGLILAPASEMSGIVEKLYQPFSYIMMPLSGAFYMVDWLPQDVQKMVYYNPMSQCFEHIRAGLLGPNVHTHYDSLYVFYVCLGMTLFGLILMRQVRKYIEFE